MVYNFKTLTRMVSEKIAHEILQNKKAILDNTSYGSSYHTFASYRIKEDTAIIYKLVRANEGYTEFKLIKQNYKTDEIEEVIKDKLYELKYGVYVTSKEELDKYMKIRFERDDKKSCKEDKYLTKEITYLKPNTPLYDKVYCSIEKKPKYGSEIRFHFDKVYDYRTHKIKRISTLIDYKYYGHIKSILRSDRWIREGD